MRGDDALPVCRDIEQEHDAALLAGNAAGSGTAALRIAAQQIRLGRVPHELRFQCRLQQQPVRQSFDQARRVKRIYCHSCETKGNLLTLLHGLETRTPPTGGRLRGQEFKAAVAKLREINGMADSPVSSAHNSRSELTNSPQRKNEAAITPQSNSSSHAGETGNGQRVSTPESKESPSERGNKEKPIEVPVNIPLRRHEKEAARELVNLYEELITDVAEMSPEAAAYVRKRPWMTSEVMKKWGCGWIPGNGRSLFRKNYAKRSFYQSAARDIDLAGVEFVVVKCCTTSSTNFFSWCQTNSTLH